MLTGHELAEQLAEYTYRPGWRLIVRDDEFEGPCFWVIADLPDAYNAGSTVMVRIRSLIPPMASRREFERWLWWRLDLIERHECREFFQRDGKPVFDPHAEPACP